MANERRRRVSWKRVGIYLLFVWAGLWLLEYPVMHVMVWNMARREARDPRAAVMPRKLLDTRIVDITDGTTVDTFGYALRVPWKVVKRFDANTVTALNFSNGAALSIFDDGNDSAGPGLLANSTPSDAAALRGVYGSVALSSRYEMLRAAFDASPSDVSFWHSRKSNAKAMTYLAEKDGMIGKATVVYSIAAGGLRGFQVGARRQRSAPVWLWLFGADDHEFWMIFHGGSDGEPTQEQINAVVASFHRTARGCSGPGCT